MIIQNYTHSPQVFNNYDSARNVNGKNTSEKPVSNEEQNDDKDDNNCSNFEV